MDIEGEEIPELYDRIDELEQQLADCESDHRQQVDKAVELHNENKRLRGASARGRPSRG